MKPAVMLSAGLLSAAIFTGVLPSSAQTSDVIMRGAARSSSTMTGVQRNAMLIFVNRTGTMGIAPHAMPEQGASLRDIVGPAVVTAVRGNVLTFRSNSGVMAGLRMPASRMRLMRITTGTLIRFTALKNQMLQLRVTGGRLLPICSASTPTMTINRVDCRRSTTPQ